LCALLLPLRPLYIGGGGNLAPPPRHPRGGQGGAKGAGGQP
jgi:hypothetical protein